MECQCTLTLPEAPVCRSLRHPRTATCSATLSSRLPLRASVSSSAKWAQQQGRCTRSSEERTSHKSTCLNTLPSRGFPPRPGLWVIAECLRLTRASVLGPASTSVPSPLPVLSRHVHSHPGAPCAPGVLTPGSLHAGPPGTSTVRPPGHPPPPSSPRPVAPDLVQQVHAAPAPQCSPFLLAPIAGPPSALGLNGGLMGTGEQQPRSTLDVGLPTSP